MRGNLPNTYTQYENTYHRYQGAVESTDTGNNGQGSTGNGGQPTNKDDERNSEHVSSEGNQSVATKKKVELSLFNQFFKNPYAEKNGKKPTATEVFKTLNLVAQYLKQTKVKSKAKHYRVMMAGSWITKSSSIPALCPAVVPWRYRSNTADKPRLPVRASLLSGLNRSAQLAATKGGTQGAYMHQHGIRSPDILDRVFCRLRQHGVNLT